MSEASADELALELARVEAEGVLEAAAEGRGVPLLLTVRERRGLSEGALLLLTEALLLREPLTVADLLPPKEAEAPELREAVRVRVVVALVEAEALGEGSALGVMQPRALLSPEARLWLRKPAVPPAQRVGAELQAGQK